MNIFHKFTWRSLRKNRVRSIVTVVGIMLSMAMFTAVIEAAYSGLAFLLRAEEKQTGSYHAYFGSMDAEGVEKLRSADGVSKVVTWQQVGWANVGSSNKYKPYLLIESVDSDFCDLVSVNMIDGRMPQNGSEIAIPTHLKSNGDVDWKIGDTVTLDVGRRVTDGTVPAEENRALVCESTDDSFTVFDSVTDTVEKSYTVVGIFERLSTNIEVFDCPGYTALTFGGGTGAYRAFFTLDHPYKLDRLAVSGEIPGELTQHTNLLIYYGVSSNSGIVSVLYGMVAILVLMIFCGSVSLIYNSFSISVSERTRQFGMLKSIGATRRQIRGTVIYEALVLCAVGIPLGMLAGCAGIGITLWCLRDSFGFLLRSGENVGMYLVITPWGLLAAALICLVTALVSAWIPARRAMRLSPIDALRQSDDIKLSRRSVRTSRLAQKIFGFEGMISAKNFARNRRRCRSTIISLFLSVTLFISASSFCSYMTGMVNGISDTIDKGADISYWSDSEDVSADPDAIYKMLMSASGVRDGMWLRYTSFYLDFPASDIDGFFAAHAEEFMAITKNDSVSILTTAMFIDDGSFRSLCSDNGVSPNEYFDADRPKALIYDKITAGMRQSGESTKWVGTSVIKKSGLPFTAHSETRKRIKGYGLDETVTGDDGENINYYYPLEYLDSVYNAGKTPDRSRALALPDSEAVIRTDFTVGAQIDKKPTVSINSGTVLLIYPASVLDGVIKDSEFSGNDNLRSRVYYNFSVDDHTAACSAMKTLLLSAGLDTALLEDQAESVESERRMVTVINVFSYGFIVLISLIAMANMFNTISTNILLRRREFAMLKSVGLTSGGFRRMMNFECARYGIRGLEWGLPAAFAVTYLIWRTVCNAYTTEFYIPWYSVAIAVCSVFAVVFAAMMYSMHMIRNDNPIDALKNENL